MDHRHGKSLHTLFYKLMTPGPGHPANLNNNNNHVEFGVMVLNYTAIRAFTVHNQTDEKLVLKFINAASGSASGN